MEIIRFIDNKPADAKDLKNLEIKSRTISRAIKNVNNRLRAEL